MTGDALRAEVGAMLGDVTIAGAMHDRAALADMDAAGWEALARARDALLAAAPDARRAICDGLDEMTRRRLVLVLLDRDFLRAVACAAVEAEHDGRE